MIREHPNRYPTPEEVELQAARHAMRSARADLRASVEETRPHMHYLELALIGPREPNRPRGTREAEPTP